MHPININNFLRFFAVMGICLFYFFNGNGRAEYLEIKGSSTTSDKALLPDTSEAKSEEKDQEISDKEAEKGVAPKISKTGFKNNFGLVVNNGFYTIYRSAKQGSKGLADLKAYLDKHDMPFPKTIVYMNKDGYKRTFPFFERFAVEEFKNQAKYGYRFYHPYDYSYRTYVDGYNPYKPQDNIDHAKNLDKEATKLFGLRKDPGPEGGIDAFFRVLNVVLNPDNQPVLFHCLGGMHRTGMTGLAIRYLQGGDWINGPKRKVFILSKFKTMLLNPAQYEYAMHNKQLFRSENLKFIEEVAKDPRFIELQVKYGDQLRAANSSDLPKMGKMAEKGAGDEVLKISEDRDRTGEETDDEFIEE